MSANRSLPLVMAGVPQTNKFLYHRIRFLVGDPAALLIEADRTTLMIRDIEADRARRHARADEVVVPASFAPPTGLSGDRETATAQAFAQLVTQRGHHVVEADRTLPMIFAHMLQEQGITVQCDTEAGVAERRAKDDQEVEWLREAQGVTEDAMRFACETIANASAGAGGVLQHDGAPLTAERLRTMTDRMLMDRGYANASMIVACGPVGADCHDRGSGELMTSQPIIVDIFPTNKDTLYSGDCTRCVVHGEPTPLVAKLHGDVCEAKRVCLDATKAGVTGDALYQTCSDHLMAKGYAMGLPPASPPEGFASMPHGVGHGIGLDVHEPPLIDRNGPALIVGDALTIEPGLYAPGVGGIRIEDMVIVRENGYDNLNTLPEGLDWTT